MHQISGTMQFGEAIGETEGRMLLNQAADLGITFLDTAEMYPVPQRESTQGYSEKAVGKWMKSARR